MERDEFWTIVEAARDGGAGDFAGRPSRLRELLRVRSPSDVASFIEHFQEAMDAAYSFELWGAAYIIGGGCSDDGFMDFRKWLVSCGRDRYERALQEPDSLVDVAFGPTGEEDAFFEEFSVSVAIVDVSVLGSTVSGTGCLSVGFEWANGTHIWDSAFDDGSYLCFSSPTPTWQTVSLMFNPKTFGPWTVSDFAADFEGFFANGDFGAWGASPPPPSNDVGITSVVKQFRIAVTVMK